MSQYAHLSTPDPEIASLIVKLVTSEPTPDVQSLRERLAKGRVPLVNENYSKLLPAQSEYTVQDHTVDVEAHGGSSSIVVRSFSPTPRVSEEPTFPVLVWFHGGGFILGGLEMDDCILKVQCVNLRITIVNVDYRLAPEHPFPAGHSDCYAALKWAATSAPSIRGSLSKGFLVGGMSAGANYAAAAAHRAAHDPFFTDRNIKLSGHIFQSPPLLHPAAYPTKYAAELLSLEQNKDAPALRKQDLLVFYGHLNGPPDDPTVSPLLADHAGLCPAYVQVCGLDPLRDEELLYVRLLREAGVEAKVDIYPGVPHGFPPAFPQFTVAQKWEEDFRAALSWMLKYKL